MPGGHPFIAAAHKTLANPRFFPIWNLLNHSLTLLNQFPITFLNHSPIAFTQSIYPLFLQALLLFSPAFPLALSCIFPVSPQCFYQDIITKLNIVVLEKVG
jgi:hypothetical protein